METSMEHNTLGMKERYSLGDTTVSCCLYPEGRDRGGEALYALRMEREGHGCKLIRLTLEEGKRIFAVMVSSRVSPIHVGDVLEDMMTRALRERLSEI